jgi:hypothetical protein
VSAALRDFNPLNVRFGSQADITPSLDYVRFAPEADIREHEDLVG